MGITGEARRFMFDNAVYSFGSALKAELASVEGKNSKEIERKSQRLLDKWLQDPNRKRRFRDPAKKDVAL